MVNRALGRNVKFSWDEYPLGQAHHRWVSRLFVYCALRGPLSYDASIFVKWSLGPNKSPSEAVVADCLCIVVDWPEGAQAVARGSLVPLRRARFRRSG